ncbi:MAG: DUF58 domain-containing protein [Blastocatellia bacterium]
MSEKKTSLLDPVFLKKLERLRIQARRAFPGVMRGERRSTRRGSSVEFADFRKYEAGDDFRHVDWNIYARLERLMLRQFVEEEDVRIDILLDQSRSMHFGQPQTKFDFARRAAATLAFLAVSSLDRISIAAFDSVIRTRLKALRGRGHLLSVLSFLDGLSDEESAAQETEEEKPVALTSLSFALRAYQKSNFRSGILFIISDFLDPMDFRTEMKLLAHRGFDLNLIQTLSPEEMRPEVGGDLLLVDSETGDAREITANERIVTAYKAALSDYTTSLEMFCRSHGIGYTLVTTDTSFEDLLLKNLVQGRMVE